MKTFGERLKWLRKDQKLTQQDFADNLGISRGALANYEVGRNEPIDAVIVLICSKFAVNETWLRTGKGDPYVKLSRQAEIARIIGQAMNASPEREALIHALADCTDDQIRTIHELVMRYVEEWQKRQANGP